MCAVHYFNRIKSAHIWFDLFSGFLHFFYLYLFDIRVNFVCMCAGFLFEFQMHNDCSLWICTMYIESLDCNNHLSRRAVNIICSRSVRSIKRLNTFYCCNFCFSQSSNIKSNDVQNRRMEKNLNMSSLLPFFSLYLRKWNKIVFSLEKLDALLIWIQFISLRGFFDDENSVNAPHRLKIVL